MPPPQIVKRCYNVRDENGRCRFQLENKRRIPKCSRKSSEISTVCRRPDEVPASFQLQQYEKSLDETKQLLGEMEAKYVAPKNRSERQKSTTNSQRNVPTIPPLCRPFLEPTPTVYNPNDYVDDHSISPIPEGVLGGERLPIKGRSRFTESYAVQRATDGDLRDVVRTIREEIQLWKKKCFVDSTESAITSNHVCHLGGETKCCTSNERVVRLPSERDIPTNHLSPVQEEAPSRNQAGPVSCLEPTTFGSRDEDTIVTNLSEAHGCISEVPFAYPSSSNAESAYPLDRYLEKVSSVGVVSENIVPNRVSSTVNHALLFEKLELLMREAERLKEPFHVNATPLLSHVEDSESGYTEDMVAAEFYKANYATKKTKGTTQEKRYYQFFSQKAFPPSNNNAIRDSLYEAGCKPPAPSLAPSPRVSTCSPRRYNSPNVLHCSPRTSHSCHSPVTPRLPIPTKPTPSLSVAQTNRIEISPDDVDKLPETRSYGNTFLISVESSGEKKPADPKILKSKGFCVQELPALTIRSPLVRQHFQVINIPPTKLSRTSQNVAFVQIEHGNFIQPSSSYVYQRAYSVHPPSSTVNTFETGLESEIRRIFRNVDEMNEKLAMGSLKLPLLTSSLNALTVALGHLLRSRVVIKANEEREESTHWDFIRKMLDKITVVSELLESEREILGSQTDDHYRRLCLIIDDVVNDVKLILTSCAAATGGEGRRYCYQNDKGDARARLPSYPLPTPTVTEECTGQKEHARREVHFERNEEDSTIQYPQDAKSNNETNVPGENNMEECEEKSIQTTECLLAKDDLPRFEKIREINRCLTLLTLHGDSDKTISPESLSSSDKDAREEEADSAEKNIDRILNETFTMDNALHYYADFEELTSASNGSQPNQKCCCEAVLTSSSCTDREDDHSLPSSGSSVSKTASKTTLTETNSSKQMSAVDTHEQPPPPSPTTTPSVEFPDKLAVRPFVQAIAHNVFASALLGASRSVEKSHFFPQSPALEASLQDDTNVTACHLKCPTVRLTNQNANTLIEINLPEKSNNFKGSITVDTDERKNEIKLSYDATHSKLVEPEYRLTMEEETQTSQSHEPPIQHPPAVTNSLSDELKDSLSLITSRMEALFQSKVNELVESCTKQMVVLKAHESNEVRTTERGPDLSSDARISSPDFSISESLLKESNSDNHKMSPEFCHESPSLLELKKLKLEEKISARLKSLTSPARDKSQQTSPVDHGQLFPFTHETIDSLLSKGINAELNTTRVVTHDQSSVERSTNPLVERPTVLPQAISRLERLLPEPPIGSDEIEETRVSYGIETPVEQEQSAPEYSLATTSPRNTDDEVYSSPQNARLSLNEPSCRTKQPEEIDGVRFYDSDLMSEGEIGCAFTSNSYSSGEIKPRNTAAKEEVAVSLHVDAEKGEAERQKEEKHCWNQSKEDLQSSFCSTTTPESTTSESL